jgi:hypothetical protein
VQFLENIKRFHTPWIKNGEAQGEQMFSALLSASVAISMPGLLLILSAAVRFIGVRLFVLRSPQAPLHSFAVLMGACGPS